MGGPLSALLTAVNIWAVSADQQRAGLAPGGGGRRGRVQTHYTMPLNGILLQTWIKILNETKVPLIVLALPTFPH